MTTRPSPEEFFDLWKNSPGHNENMLGSRYSKIGICLYGNYATNIFE